MKNLIAKYRELGVKLWVEDGSLKFRAQKGVLTPERKQELKENKEELIRFLMEQENLSHDEAGRYDPFPLTDIQAAYLVGRHNEYGSGGVGCKVYLELTGKEMEDQKLNEAWKQVVSRHDMMRAVIWENATQQIKQEVEIPDIRIIRDSDGQAREALRKELIEKNYDPQTWPLYDICLVHEKGQDVLCFSIDMLVADFTSITILLNELEAVYYEKTLSPLPPVTFRDVILDQVSGKKAGDTEKAKAYWMERLESLPGAPELPVVDKNPETTRVVQKNLLLGYDNWETIEAFARDHKLTAASVVLNIYADVLARWSSGKDFTVNVTMADRRNPRADVRGMVGDFTIVDLLEIHQNPRLSFVQRAENIQKQLWNDLEYTAFSGVSVIRELKRVKETESLFPVVFTSTLGYKAEKTQADGLVLTYKISQTPQVWIDCQVSEEKNGILVNWDVRDGVFPEGMIDAAFEAFARELQALAVAPDQMESYHYENSEAVQAVRSRVNDTTGAVPAGLLQDAFLSQVQSQPDHPAIIDEEGSCSYKSLYGIARRIADRILEKQVAPGTMIAVDLEKSRWSVAAALGILLADGIYLPLEASQPLERKKEILEEAGTDWGLHQGKSDLFADHGVDVALLKEAGEETAGVDPLSDQKNGKRGAKDPAYVIFTSGSTGKPKGVVISHQAAKNTIVDINERFGVTGKDRVLALARNAFDLSIYDLFGLLSVGGTLVIPDPKKQKDPQHWYEQIEKHQVTIWNSVPAQMQMLTMYAATLPAPALPLKLVLLSGDWIPVSLPREIEAIAGNARVVGLGGATEASIWSNYYVVEKGETFAVSIPYGKPLKNQFFHVLDEELEECPDWVAGELYIGGTGLAEGYQNNEEETRSHFLIHPVTGERLYRTGDLGRYLPDGNLEFLGRVDRQVKIHGHRIEVQEIENKLMELEGVGQAVVTVRKAQETAAGLNAFLELEQQKDSRHVLVEDKALGEAVKKAGDEGTAHIDRELFQKWTKTANITALYDIFAYLKSRNLFIDAQPHTMEEIYEKTGVHDYYKQLIRRWIGVLCREGFLSLDSRTRTYRCLRPDIEKQTSIDSWKQWWDIENRMHYGKKLVEYFQDSSNHLPQLVTGEIDALDIFFPQGDFTIAKAAYHDNLLSNSLNQVIIGAIRHIYEKLHQEDENRVLRILEIGAGVGGASLDVIPALADCRVSYLFSDVSQYFLNAARKNFEAYDFVTYGLFDINKPYWEQGIRPSQFDLIICNNVLHNARSLPDVLQSFREILTPGGSFIIEDTTGENYSLLTSMEFHAGLSQFEDFRKESNEVFVTRQQWREVLQGADGEIAAEYPTETDPLAEAKQVVFTGQFVNRTSLLTPEEIQETIRGKMPEYMVPDHVEILDRIPLTENGKVDRKTLDQMAVNEEKAVEGSGKELKAGLEEQIGEIWKKALNRETIYRDENFYKAGGDSLLLAQIVSQMKEQIDVFADWEWNRIMTEIIQDPTIAGIAAKALEIPGEMAEEEEKADESSLKWIKRLDTSKRLLVLFHDGTGTISPYESLIPYLEKESTDSVAGVFVRDAKAYAGYEEGSLLQELGTGYAKELEETGYESFCLIGYCMGGLVAVETAKNLMEAGVVVESVLTIDTTPADPRICNDILMERTFGMLLGADLTACGYLKEEELLKKALLKLLKEKEGPITVEDLSGLDGDFAPVGENTKSLLEMDAETRLRLICDHIPRLNQEISSYQYEQMKDLYGVLRKSFAGMAQYGQDFFTGDVVALNCSDKTSNFLPVLENRNQEFWEAVTLGDLKRITIEGNHISCMQEPLVKNVADIILQKGRG